jgi:hypothetical protein
MYSVIDNLYKKAGFPHSEISGSTFICQLPEAYRKLLRPSSPLTAKASTVCAYSLDYATLGHTSYENAVIYASIPLLITFCINKLMQIIISVVLLFYQIVKEQCKCTLYK